MTADTLATAFSHFSDQLVNSWSYIVFGRYFDKSCFFAIFYKIICIVLEIILHHQHKLLNICILWKQTPRKRNKQTANRGQILPPCLFYFPASKICSLAGFPFSWTFTFKPDVFQELKLCNGWRFQVKQPNSWEKREFSQRSCITLHYQPYQP